MTAPAGFRSYIRTARIFPSTIHCTAILPIKALQMAAVRRAPVIIVGRAQLPAEAMPAVRRREVVMAVAAAVDATKRAILCPLRATVEKLNQTVC